MRLWRINDGCDTHYSNVFDGSYGCYRIYFRQFIDTTWITTDSQQETESSSGGSSSAAQFYAFNCDERGFIFILYYCRGTGVGESNGTEWNERERERMLRPRVRAREDDHNRLWRQLLISGATHACEVQKRGGQKHGGVGVYRVRRVRKARAFRTEFR